jgi:hypothetical protein
MKRFDDYSVDWTTQKDPNENAKLLALHIQKPPNWSVFIPDIREHTANIAEIHSINGKITDFGEFVLMSENFPGVYIRQATDGVIVVNHNEQLPENPITLWIKIADCWGVTFAYRNKVFWIIHCGWKGVARGIIEETIKKLSRILWKEAISEISFQISPMAQDGYEFWAQDFDNNFTSICKKYSISPSEIFL